MKNVTFLLSLSALVAVTFLIAPSVSAQTQAANRPGGGFGLVQTDYQTYAQHFKIGKEPNLSPIGNERWRSLYRNHHWAEYASGGEFRDPMHEAQTLVGIYLLQNVDHRLTYQIESIVRSKAQLSGALAERMTLDRVAVYWNRGTTGDAGSNEDYDADLAKRKEAVGEGSDFYSEDEIYALQLMSRDLDVIARKRIINPYTLSNALQIEIKSVQNKFDYGETGWAPTYYYMREKFRILDDLSASFTFNWTEEQREAAIQELMADPALQREVETTVKAAAARAASARTSASTMSSGSSYPGYGDDSYDSYSGGISDGYSGGSDSLRGDSGDLSSSAPAMTDQTAIMMQALMQAVSEEDRQKAIEKQIQEQLRPEAEKKLKKKENREKAYQYVVGVYESTEAHMRTLRQIERYFRNAAERDDVIAKYHLALFLRYLGDLTDRSAEAAELRQESEELLKELENNDLTKGRIKELRAQFVREDNRRVRNEMDEAGRLQALIKVENDKLDMFDEVLLMVLDRISSGDNTGGSRRSLQGGNSGYGGGSSYGSDGGSSSSGRSSRGSGNSSSGRSSSRGSGSSSSGDINY